MKIKSRVSLRKNDKNKIVASLHEVFGDSMSALSDSKFEVITTDEFKVIFVDGKQMFFEFGGEIFPTVRGALLLSPEKRLVVVDMGAVKFVVNGADVMSPGIVSADPSIQKEDLVVVVDETHKKPLAIGRALISGTEMTASASGKAVKSLAYVGDALWDLEI
ncbi:RNA-binding protein [Methanolapillus ohkumae]|uniref:RNA-binding protein n=1 Tax=Methanolapillus ohkumae TaxID=3028298 RepID=UPI0030B8BC37